MNQLGVGAYGLVGTLAGLIILILILQVDQLFGVSLQSNFSPAAVLRVLPFEFSNYDNEDTSLISITQEKMQR